MSGGLQEGLEGIGIRRQNARRAAQTLAGGDSSAIVAKRMGVSKRTIDFHLANIYNKLGVINRMQAYRRAVRLQLVEI